LYRETFLLSKIKLDLKSRILGDVEIIKRYATQQLMSISETDFHKLLWAMEEPLE
jgi:hypothetical protein